MLGDSYVLVMVTSLISLPRLLWYCCWSLTLLGRKWTSGMESWKFISAKSSQSYHKFNTPITSLSPLIDEWTMENVIPHNIISRSSNNTNISINLLYRVLRKFNVNDLEERVREMTEICRTTSLSDCFPEHLTDVSRLQHGHRHYCLLQALVSS